MAHVIGIGYSENNKWVFTYNNVGFITSIFTARKSRVILFGKLEEGSELTTSSENTLLSYATEDELENAVNTFVNDNNYYKEQAEAFDSLVYLGESEKYPVIIPIPPDPPEPEPGQP